jgi:hypothetical protein
MTNYTAYTNIDSALEAQKAITGSYYYDGFAKSEHDINVKLNKGNVDEYMVLDNGDIYFVYKLGAERILNKLNVGGMISSGNLGMVRFEDNKIIPMFDNVVDKGNRAKRQEWADLMRDLDVSWAFTELEVA